MTAGRKVCIVDANILFDFLAGECLETLFSLPFEFRTSDIVASEVRHSISTEELCGLGLIIEGFESKQIASMYQIQQDHLELSIQDISVFFLAHRYGAYLISGDSNLREFCEAETIECHGTIWCLENLLEMKRIRHRNAAIALRKMLDKPKPPRRLPRAECEKRIRKWESMEGSS